jgi:MauM/NapG family ferredoxin protein
LFARDKARSGTTDAMRRQALSGEEAEAEAERAGIPAARRGERAFDSDPAECIMCLECAGACAYDAQAFRGQGTPVLTAAPWQAYDPSRRQFLASAGAAVALVGLAAVEPVAERTPAHLLRPPGALDGEFLAQCVRCGICLKVCPTSALQPSLTTGWSGLWTPVLTPRIGYCDYSCNACGQACPTGAIPPLALAEKRQTVMGHAYVDRTRCLPWASGRSCITCEEMCPVPQKAIRLEEVEAVTPDGQPITLKRPIVMQERCIGCGICENHCPLEGQAAIRVYAPTDLGVGYGG